MKPLSLQFRETPTATERGVDFSQIVYDERLNLSVNKTTGRPAVDEMELGTETYTRVTGEATDSDCNDAGMLMATETATKTHGEGADSDHGRFVIVMETATTTFVANEATDSDK